MKYLKIWTLISFDFASALNINEIKTALKIYFVGKGWQSLNNNGDNGSCTRYSIINQVFMDRL